MHSASAAAAAAASSSPAAASSPSAAALGAEANALGSKVAAAPKPPAAPNPKMGAAGVSSFFSSVCRGRKGRGETVRTGAWDGESVARFQRGKRRAGSRQIFADARGQRSETRAVLRTAGAR